MIAYKDSGIEWVGRIPVSWDTIANKYVMKKQKRICEKWNGENVLSLTLNGVIIRDIENPTGKMPASFDGYQYAYKNELLMCLFDIDVTPRCVGKVEDNGVTSPAYSCFSMSDGYDAGYYYYYYLMVDNTKELLHLAKNLRHSFTEEQLGTLKVPVPPFDVQKRISTFLDSECAEIDKEIKKFGASIAEYRNLRQAIITQAVTQGIDNKPLEKDSGIAWIGSIPADWNVSKIKYVATVNPSCSSTHASDDLITYTPMEYIKNGYYVPNTALFGSVAASLTSYEEGDVVLAKVTPCFENGNVAVMENLESGYGVGSSELFVFRPHKIDRRYLMYWFQNLSFIQRGCATMTGTGGLKRVSPYFIKNCEIHLPPLEEQTRIASYLDKQCEAVDALIAKKELFLTELESYKRSLIYDYVTGKKEVQ